MKRRHFLTAGGAAATLGMPRIGRAAREQTLTFVPLINLVVLDPVASGFRGTHNHGYLVYDTLYGLDEKSVTRPQMIEATSAENNRTLWTLRLRGGLRFHDGQPVLARDAVASIRRFAARDMLGQSLITATSDLSCPDDRTIQFKLRRPFPHLATALAGSATTMPCIMPERLAVMDPFKPVPETIGSGPFRFVSGEFIAGERAVYERFTGYVSRTNETQSYTAGPKIAHFDRVQWQAINDGATAAAALLRGEVDWIESPNADLIPMLARSQDVKVEVKETSGSIGIMRFNQLHPPFDNPAVRRALLGAIDQADIMTAVAGPDRNLWRDRIGLFGPTSPLVTEAGIDVMTSPRDYQKVKQQLSAAGYRGEKIVVASSEIGFLSAITHVAVDQLKRAGMNVDLQFTDLPTLFRRRSNKAPPDQGGWNIFIGIQDCLFNDNPGANWAIRGLGKDGYEGWPESSALESLRDNWLEAEDVKTEARVAEKLQMQLWQDVPYIPLGHWVRSAAHRTNIVDIPWGFPAFYGVRRG